MSRPNPYVLSCVLLLFVAVFGGYSIVQGGLYLDTHEADTYHLMDILFRMESGLLPHQDFVTPIGILAFLPIVLFMQAGLGVGIAILWAQLAVALVMWPAVVYSAVSRLPKVSAYVFGVLALGLVLALTYGGSQSGASISMHYNRWAWSAAFVMSVLALLPPRGRAFPVLDGLLIGSLASILLLVKITFFVALVPTVAVLLLWRRSWTVIASALAAGLLIAIVVTLAFGVGHWTGYISDLLNVASSDVRPFVGVPFDRIVAGPPYVGGVLVAVLSVFLLRQTGHRRVGLMLLFLVVGFLYITYQNFGNDPKWLLLLPILLMSLRPTPGDFRVMGADAADLFVWLSIAATAFIFPSAVNLALSPMNHAAIQSAKFIPMLPGRPDDQDIFIRADRANSITAQVELDSTSPLWSKYSEVAGRAPQLELAGVEFPKCELMAGARAYMVEIAADLEKEGIPAGSQFFTTDVLTAFWLFGPYAPLQGGAPWYYGDVSGIENADYVLVPKCSFLAQIQRIMVDDLKSLDFEYLPVVNNELYALFAINR